MKKAIQLLAATALILSVGQSKSSAATTFKLNKGKLQTISSDGKKYLCGSPTSKWIPVKKSGSSYAQLKPAPSAHTSACNSMIPRAAVRSLSQLPDISEMTRTSRAKSQVVFSSGLSDFAVSGEAPVIAQVPELDVTQLFWRPGVISSINSGSPSETDCQEFWGSSVDGQSSGQTACYMLQDVGRSISEIVHSGTSLCYMKNVPTSNVVAAKAAKVVKGTLPAGGLPKLFDAPEGSKARVIRVDFGGSGGRGDSKLFIRVSPRAELDKASNLYKFDIWNCSGSVIGTREIGTVKLTGEFISASTELAEDYQSSNIVKGFLSQNGRDITFDTSRERSLANTSINGGFGGLSQITVNSANEMISKQLFQGSTTNQKSFAIASFAGSSLADLQFLAGATKMNFQHDNKTDSFEGSSEYRDTFYTAAPGSGLSERVHDFSIENDSFYSASVVPPSIDKRGISCSSAADINIELNMDHPTMVAIAQSCEAQRLAEFDMCRSQAVQQAQQNFQSVCLPGDQQPQ